MFQRLLDFMNLELRIRLCRCVAKVAIDNFTVERWVGVEGGMMLK